MQSYIKDKGEKGGNGDNIKKENYVGGEGKRIWTAKA